MKETREKASWSEREKEGDPDDLGALFALCCCWLMFLTLISHSYGYTAISHRQSRRTQPLSKPLAASSSRLLLLWVLPKRKKEDNKEEYNTRAKEKKKKAQIRKHVRDTRDFVVTEAMTGYAEHIQQTEHWKLKVESVGNIRGQWEKKMPALYWSARLGLFFFFGGERKVSRPSTATIAAMATGYSLLFPSSNRNIHLTRLGARIYTFVLDFLLFFFVPVCVPDFSCLFSSSFNANGLDDAASCLCLSLCIGCHQPEVTFII